MKTTGLGCASLRAALSSALLALAAIGAFAQGAAQQSHFDTPLLDFRVVCAEVNAQMLQPLAQVAMRERSDGVLYVLFELDGQRIGRVAMSGTPTFVFLILLQRGIEALPRLQGNRATQRRSGQEPSDHPPVPARPLLLHTSVFSMPLPT